MSEHLRALVVIIGIASLVFFMIERPCLSFVSPAEFKRWRNIWFASTLSAFLAMSFWLYMLIASLIVLVGARKYQNRTALFFLLLFVIPAGGIQIPGFGLINYFFEINQPRLLAIVLLLPCFFTSQRLNIGVGRVSDWLFLAFIALTAILQLRQTTVTDTARFTFQLFLDSALPYYVFSRSIKDIQAIRQTLLCFVIGCMVISSLAIFEVLKHWLLFSSLTGVLGISTAGGYLDRSDIVRAIGPTGHPIALGYTMMVAIGFYFYFMNNIESTVVKRAGLVLLVGGLVASLSRGPWLGTLALIAVFAATGPNPVRTLIRLGIGGLSVLAFLAFIPGGHKVLDLLPFIGSVDAANIEYRQKLFENAMIVIQRNLWFGSIDYLNTPEMRELIQGEGIIDIVNSYIGIALSVGVAGLSLFILCFLSTILYVLRAMRATSKWNLELHTLGRAILATMIAVIVTIATVSSVFNISVIYWCLAGLSVAYARIVAETVQAAYTNEFSIAQGVRT